MNVTRLLDLPAGEIGAILDRAAALRQGAGPARYEGKLLGLLFEKPSTRTRVSFEAAAAKLGASHLFIAAGDTQLQRGEPIEDVAKVLGRYLDALAVRTFAQATVEALAAHAGIPVINALSDRYHPCQALADVATVEQHLGRRDGFVLTYLGDGNNVFASLAEAAARLPFALRFAGPADYAPEPALIEEVRAAGADVVVGEDPHEAVDGADAVYTDVWTSMGQETEAEARRRVFEPYRVDGELMRRAPDAIVLHCLPAHRDEEIASEVIDGPSSRVFDQAENRMWTQMALLEHLWACDRNV